MDVSEHYIQLRLMMNGVQDGQDIDITIGKLAHHLCCTMRNMNLIMNKFKENGWVQWKPQRGRGKKSVLVFCIPLLDVSRNRFDQLLRGNRMEEAYELAASLPFALKEELMRDLQHQFGLHSNKGGKGRVDTLRIPQNTPYETLDPTKTGMWGEVFVITEIFDRLVRYNAERQACEPSLAIAWDSDSEGREWTFYLHKGILFHHGRILDADDVKFTFDRIVYDRSNPCWPLFRSIERVEVLDELTVRFVLNSPNYMLPDLLSSMCASILPRDVELDPLRPIGTGPYRITRHDSKLLVLEVFSSYFRGRAYIDRVEVWQLPASGSAESIIKQELFAGTESRAVQHEIQGGVYMTFNMRKEGPQQDVLFRRAIQQLLKPEQFTVALRSPGTQAAYSLIRGRVPEQHRTERIHEGGGLAQASELLNSSSYAGERLMVWVEKGERMEAEMAWFAERCEQIGLHITIMAGEPADAVSHDDFRSCDLIYTGEVFDDHILLSLLMMYSFRNTLFLIAMNDYWKQELEQECGRVVMIPEAGVRMERMVQLEERLMDEALLLPAYSFSEEHAHHASLRDYRLAGYGMPDLRRLWIRRRQETEYEDASYPLYIPLW